MAKRALLIGINRYRIPGADLRGCVNDVLNIRNVLTGRFGFPKRNVSTLLDFKATTRDMQDGIRKLLRGARRGDVLLLHYSGHGANVPDDNGDEADFRDEILCPTDLDWKKPLTDDWLRKTFDTLPAGVNLTVIMDCCHSGTNTRAIQPPDAPSIPRYLPNPWDIMACESGRKLRGKTRTTLRSAPRAARSRRDLFDVDIPEVLITGCRDTQTSADAFIGGSYNGALTWNLVAALERLGAESTYRALHAATAAGLKKGRYEQVPQLEGRSAALDLPFLAPIA